MGTTSRGRTSRRRRRLVTIAASLAAAAALLLSVRSAVAEVFYVATDSVSPEIPRGARVLVYKLDATVETGTLVAFRRGDEVWLGRVAAVDAATGAVALDRNPGPMTVHHADVVGRVVLTTR